MWQASTRTLLRTIQVLRLEAMATQSDITVLSKQLKAAREGSVNGLYVVPRQGPDPPLSQSARAGRIAQGRSACRAPWRCAG
jgi:hypothetical protein